MAVVKNTFSTTFDSIESMAKHTIIGLTSEASTTSTSYYVSPAVTLYFLRSIYQTLLDAGYSDAIMNEEEYSITVLGFKFYCTCGSSYINSFDYGFIPELYVQSFNTRLNSEYNTNFDEYIQISNMNSNNLTNINLGFNIIVRGSKDCVQIAYSSYLYPNSEVPLLLVAKAKDLINSKDMFLFGNTFSNNSGNYNYWRWRYVDNLYSHSYSSSSSSTYDCVSYPYYNYTGLNSINKYVCEPVLINYGTIKVNSMIKANNNLHENGKYYKISSDMYFCYGYKYIYNSSYSGLKFLFKVSDD